MKNRINAIEYMECSALTTKGIHYLFDTAIKSLMDDGKECEKKKEKIEEKSCKWKCVIF